MMHERQSHVAYHDYIREVGAPDLMVTDNSNTQNGEKWTRTIRHIMTKQRRFVPYNQNQIKSERRIQDVKHKTVNVLEHAGAPLVFWCYAMIFVVDCLNYLAKNSLK